MLDLFEDVGRVLAAFVGMGLLGAFLYLAVLPFFSFICRRMRCTSRTRVENSSRLPGD